MPEPTVAEISADDLASKGAPEEVQIVDVRTDEEWAAERIAGSRHVVLDELTGAAESVDRSRPVVFVCSAGNRSAMAAEAFRASGYDAYSLAGGLEEWRARGHDLESG